MVVRRWRTQGGIRNADDGWEEKAVNWYMMVCASLTHTSPFKALKLYLCCVGEMTFLWSYTRPVISTNR